jgi:hypothetical protein
MLGLARWWVKQREGGGGGSSSSSSSGGGSGSSSSGPAARTHDDGGQPLADFRQHRQDGVGRLGARVFRLMVKVGVDKAHAAAGRVDEEPGGATVRVAARRAWGRERVGGRLALQHGMGTPTQRPPPPPSRLLPVQHMKGESTSPQAARLRARSPRPAPTHLPQVAMRGKAEHAHFDCGTRGVSDSQNVPDASRVSAALS